MCKASNNKIKNNNKTKKKKKKIKEGIADDDSVFVRV